MQTRIARIPANIITKKGKINGTFLKINMKGRNFKYEVEPFIVLAGDNIPERSDKEHFTGVTFHELKLYSNERLLSHHTFDEFIHDKSVDKTGNCNFIHKF